MASINLVAVLFRFFFLFSDALVDFLPLSPYDYRGISYWNTSQNNTRTKWVGCPWRARTDRENMFMFKRNTFAYTNVYIYIVAFQKLYYLFLFRFHFPTAFIVRLFAMHTSIDGNKWEKCPFIVRFLSYSRHSDACLVFVNRRRRIIFEKNCLARGWKSNVKPIKCCFAGKNE